MSWKLSSTERDRRAQESVLSEEGGSYVVFAQDVVDDARLDVEVEAADEADGDQYA